MVVLLSIFCKINFVCIAYCYRDIYALLCASINVDIL